MTFPARLRDRLRPPVFSSRVCRCCLLAFWIGILAVAALRYVHLSADFPNNSPWMDDQAKYTDEGWYASGAVVHEITGHWYAAGDFNPAVALPVWSFLVGLVFHFTGLSFVAARTLNVSISIATLPAVYLLVRRFARAPAACAAVVLIALSPFAFVFCRLAILDTLVAFEFCLLLLAASYAAPSRRWPLAVFVLLTPFMLLSKTTSAVLIPAVCWVAWSAQGRTRSAFLRVAVAAVGVPFALVKAYSLIVSALGYGPDYRHFFDINAMPDIAWGQTFAQIHDISLSCLWIDRLLAPAALLVLVLSLAWKRRLWANPLFTASWLAIAGDLFFIFCRQDDFAPRYFLVLLAPVVWIAILALDEFLGQNRSGGVPKPLHSSRRAVTSARWAAGLLAAVLAFAAATNGTTIAGFLLHPQHQFAQAAQSMARMIRADRSRNPLLLGVSGPQISFMTGIPSVNEAFGMDDQTALLKRSRPGWYLIWNEIDPPFLPKLAPYKLDEAARFSVFDNDDRNLLILYRMDPRAQVDSQSQQP